MKHELAKELKEAGFPQKWEEGIAHPLYIPTLSELIEACGVAFSELTKMTHTAKIQRWVAVSYACEECGIETIKDGFGSTPEEAVARLWLALNKK